MAEPFIVKIDETDLDVAYCDEFARALSQIADQTDVIIDLSSATYIDSTCLSKLIAMRNGRSRGGFPAEKLVLPSANVRRVLTIVALDNMWPLFHSLQDALATNS
ncbi:MAG TPA: STAS domain-containing protein [Candidatus Baltobacteraceae bacterium]|nr:STAS domain-containing protein [Candidatus Baltobacteraceae bacterium]